MSIQVPLLSHSPVSVGPELRTPACVDRTSIQSLATVNQNSLHVELEPSQTGDIVEALVSAKAELSSPRTPSSPTPASLVAACSYCPQPFRKLPAKKNASCERPPRSPAKEAAVSLTGAPLSIPPRIVTRLNPAKGETLTDLVMKSSITSLLRSLPPEERAAFVQNNPKLCGHIVLHSGESSKKRRKKSKCGKCGLKRDDGGHMTDFTETSGATMKDKTVSTRDSQLPQSGKEPATVSTRDSQVPQSGKEPANEDEATTSAVIAKIDSVISEFKAMRNTLLMKSSPSPRESSKGGKTKASNSLIQKVKQVGVGKIPPRDLSSDSSNPVACHSGSGSLLLFDPLSLGTWDVERNVPPCQVNNMAQPVGQYWRHMKNFAFERATYTFPWHLDWSQEDALTKVRFKLRLKKLYPGDWDDGYVMQMVGNNVREKQVRLRRSFAKAPSKNSVPVVGGVTLESWNVIFDSLSNPQYQAKSDKCKVAADERTRRKGFTHKLGPRGVQGFVNAFLEEFDRKPTKDEVLFAKQNGIQAALDNVRNGNVGVPIQAAVQVSKPTKPQGKKTSKRARSEEDSSAQEDGDASSGEEGDADSDSEDDGSGTVGSGSESSTEETGSEAEDDNAGGGEENSEHDGAEDDEDEDHQQLQSPSLSTVLVCSCCR